MFAREKLREEDKTEMFLILFNKHRRAVYLLIKSLLQTDCDADDVFQEVCLILWRKFDEFEYGTNFLAWANQIVRYQVLHWKRKMQSSRQVFSDELCELIADEMTSSPERYDERFDALEDCFAFLPENARSLLSKRYGEEKDVQTIAGETAATKDAVYQNLCRLRLNLRRCIEGKLFKTPKTT